MATNNLSREDEVTRCGNPSERPPENMWIFSPRNVCVTWMAFIVHSSLTTHNSKARPDLIRDPCDKGERKNCVVEVVVYVHMCVYHAHASSIVRKIESKFDKNNSKIFLGAHSSNDFILWNG